MPSQNTRQSGLYGTINENALNNFGAAQPIISRDKTAENEYRYNPDVNIECHLVGESRHGFKAVWERDWVRNTAASRFTTWSRRPH